MTVREITVQDLQALGSSARVIDVREPHEWDDVHIAHAELVPLATVPDRVDAFDGEPTYVVCRSGNRSGKACEFLGAQGRDVVNVAGGMLAWIAAGFPTEPNSTTAADSGPAGG
jgi:rhodanese-related sulfurtransferase